MRDARLPKLVLLPGMDGTGELFREFVKALPDEIKTEVVRYPGDVILSYVDLMPFVLAAIPESAPFVLLAESFSTPLAIEFAASCPSNLKGVIICVGFVASPAQGWRRLVASLFAPVAFRVTPPKFVLRFLMAGRDAPLSRRVPVGSALSEVEPKVMAARLRAVLRCDVRAELGRVAVPIFYLQAMQDRLVGGDCVEEILRVRPETVVEAIDGPHQLLQRHPQRSAGIVAEFLRRMG